MTNVTLMISYETNIYFFLYLRLYNKIISQYGYVITAVGIQNFLLQAPLANEV